MPAQSKKEKIAQRKKEERRVGIGRGVKKKSSSSKLVRKPTHTQKDRLKWKALDERPRASREIKVRAYNNYYERAHGKKKK